jgi:hypothetical protein
MRRFALLIVIIACPLAFAATTASASGTIFSFNLVGPNSAENPTSHDTIQTTGSGTFDQMLGRYRLAARSRIDCRTGRSSRGVPGWRRDSTASGLSAARTTVFRVATCTSP